MIYDLWSMGRREFSVFSCRLVPRASNQSELGVAWSAILAVIMALPLLKRMSPLDVKQEDTGSESNSTPRGNRVLPTCYTCKQEARSDDMFMPEETRTTLKWSKMGKNKETWLHLSSSQDGGASCIIAIDFDCCSNWWREFWIALCLSLVSIFYQFILASLPLIAIFKLPTLTPLAASISVETFSSTGCTWCVYLRRPVFAILKRETSATVVMSLWHDCGQSYGLRFETEIKQRADC